MASKTITIVFFSAALVAVGLYCKGQTERPNKEISIQSLPKPIAGELTRFALGQGISISIDDYEKRKDEYFVEITILNNLYNWEVHEEAHSQVQADALFLCGRNRHITAQRIEYRLAIKKGTKKTFIFDKDGVRKDEDWSLFFVTSSPLFSYALSQGYKPSKFYLTNMTDEFESVDELIWEKKSQELLEYSKKIRSNYNGSKDIEKANLALDSAKGFCEIWGVKWRSLFLKNQESKLWGAARLAVRKAAELKGPSAEEAQSILLRYDPNYKK